MKNKYMFALLFLFFAIVTAEGSEPIVAAISAIIGLLLVLPRTLYDKIFDYLDKY